MQDITGITGRQILDDIFEESRLHRADLGGDVAPDAMPNLTLPTDPYIGHYAGPVQVDGQTHDDGETLVIASDAQERRYLLKRWDNRSTFKVYQQTPVEGERMRLLNVYRVMIGQPVS